MRKIFIQCLKIIISGILVFFLLNKIGLKNISEAFEGINLLWMIGAFLLFTFSHIPGSYQWKRLLEAERIKIPFHKVLSLYFIGLFFNNVLIGGIGGDFYRMNGIRKISRNGAAAVSTVFMDRVIGLLVLSSMAVISAPWLLIRGKLPVYFQWALLIIIFIWVFMLCFFFIRRFARIFSWLIKKILPASLHMKSVDVYNNIYAFGRQPRLFIEVVGISLIVQNARILMHFFLCRSLGINISPIYFFLFVPIIAIVASLPVSFGGIGVRENFGALLFSTGGARMAQPDAVAMEFLAYLVSVASSLPGFLLFMFRKEKSHEEEKVE